MSLESKAVRLVRAQAQLEQSVERLEKVSESYDDNLFGVVKFAGAYALAKFQGLRYSLVEETFMYKVALSDRTFEAFSPVGQAFELLDINGVNNGS